MPSGIYKKTEEHKRKLALANKGKKHLGETKKKMSLAHKGKIFTKKHREEISKAKMGEKNPMFNKKKSEETRIKLSLSLMGRKHSEETKNKLSLMKKGKKNHNWQGGISFEPYGLEFNKDLKEVIRNRDRRKCQICEKTELESGKALDVHHIDYNKNNNNPNNLISLCRSCHIKTNYNRNEWIEYFK